MSYGYDKHGRHESTTDVVDNTTRMSYDDNGILSAVRMTRPDGSEVSRASYAYDDCGERSLFSATASKPATATPQPIKCLPKRPRVLARSFFPGSTRMTRTATSQCQQNRGRSAQRAPTSPRRRPRTGYDAYNRLVEQPSIRRCARGRRSGRRTRNYVFNVSGDITQAMTTTAEHSSVSDYSY